MGIIKFLEHIFAEVTLGLLCGWYYFLIFLVYPLLLYYIFVERSVVAGTITAVLITLSFLPLKHQPWQEFMNSWIFRIWCDYFEFSTDVAAVAPLKKDRKYMFCEFPHGVFPMGPFLSVFKVKDCFPGEVICGTGADVVFAFPVMRHIMSWLGTRRASRKGIKNILDSNQHMAIIPGGIAEMYLVSEDEEAIYLRKRHNTVKVALEEGLDIIPTFFFGTSKILKLVGGKNKNNKNENDSEASFLAKISRKLRVSILFFYGKYFLPIPIQHPIRMVCGPAIEVEQDSNPSPEKVQALLDKLIKAVEELYETKKPEWETRPLVIY